MPRDVSLDGRVSLVIRELDSLAWGGGGGGAFSCGLGGTYIRRRLHEHSVIRRARWRPHGASFCLPLPARQSLVGGLSVVILLCQTL